MSNEQEFEGIWDDVQEALKWKPVLPKLKAFEDAKGTADKAHALQDLAAFAIQTGTGQDPYKNRSFLAFAKFVSLIKNDWQVRHIVEDALSIPHKK